MDQNSAQTPAFNMDYAPLRKPHSRGETPTLHSSAASVLSPNAKEFVPQNKHLNNQQQQMKPNSSVSNLTNSFNKVNINPQQATVTIAAQQQQYHQQHHHHQQQPHQQHFNHHQQQQQHQYHQQNSHSKPVLSSVPSNLQERLKPQQHHHHHQQQQQQQQQLFNLQQMQHIQHNASTSRNKPSPSSSSLSSVQNRIKNPSQQQHQQHNQYYHNNHHAQQQQQQSSSTSSIVNSNGETSQNASSSEQRGEDETFALNYISDIVDCLSSDPGSFDSIASRALLVFHDYGENQYVLSNAMEIIFNQSIEEQNFRYMGAKLYGLLDSLNPKNDSVFRSLLTFKLRYHRQEIINFMQNENAKVRGTTLFLAELYMQLRNNGSRIPEIAQNIIFTMQQLLQKHTPENIKCICLTLKLAGYDLEADCPNDLLNIIESLRQVKMDVSTNRVLDTTLTLHKNNWGRNETINQLSYNTNNPIRYSNEPVFYGPDGQVLTEEENSFLEANIPSDVNNEEDPDDFDDEYELDTGMDPEMEKDYNEFLKNTINHSC